MHFEGSGAAIRSQLIAAASPLLTPVSLSSPQCRRKSWRAPWPTWSVRSRGWRTTSSTSPRRTTRKISSWRRCRYPFFFPSLSASCFALLFALRVRFLKAAAREKQSQDVFYERFSWRLFVFVPGPSKCFESLVVMGGARGNSGNESGYLAARCWSDLLSSAALWIPGLKWCLRLFLQPAVPRGTLIGAAASHTNLSPIPDFIFRPNNPPNPPHLCTRAFADRASSLVAPLRCR